MASWPKKIRLLVNEIRNAPSSIEDCWFVPATKDDGYHETKFSADGSKGKFRTHRWLRLLLEPNMYSVVAQRDERYQAMHVCGLGKASRQNGPACINPYHIRFGTSEENNNMKACGNTCAWLCPHPVKCRMNWPDTGKPKPCFNDPHQPPPLQCPHERTCKHTIEKTDIVYS
jgi:hypothetical protein